MSADQDSITQRYWAVAVMIAAIAAAVLLSIVAWRNCDYSTQTEKAAIEAGMSKIGGSWIYINRHPDGTREWKEKEASGE